MTDIKEKGPGASTPSPQHNAIKPLEDSKMAAKIQGFIELQGDARSTAIALIEGAMAGAAAEGVTVTVDYEGAPPACATVLVVLDRARFLELAVAGWAPSLQLPAQELVGLILKVHSADWSCEDLIGTLRDPADAKQLLRDKIDREETADELEREFQERGRICETILEIARDPARLAGAIPAAASVWARAFAKGGVR